jgi:mRNA-degrading endonuclease RelE of RelBE toxin-antitoxin system
MAIDPPGGDVKPVKGLKGLLRRRIGDCRIGFTINFEKTELIKLRVGRRAEFY